MVVIVQFSRGGKAVVDTLTLADVNGDAFNTLLGPIALIISQALVLIQKVVYVVASPEWSLLLYAAVLYAVVTSTSKWTLLGGAYVLMTADTWLAYFGVPPFTEGESMLAFSPFNLDALDASWVLHPLFGR